MLSPRAQAGLKSIGRRGITLVVQYAKCRKAIGRFLRQDRIGAIGHVSCVDRRSRAAGLTAAGSELKDLAAVSASQLTGICALLGLTPNSVTARSTHNDRITSLQAFLKINEQVGVHYFATEGAGPSEHELWIEGAKGSLRTDGNSVWWRKGGWPVFVPIRIGIVGVPAESKSQLADYKDMTAAIERSAGGEGTVSIPGNG